MACVGWFTRTHGVLGLEFMVALKMLGVGFIGTGVMFASLASHHAGHVVFLAIGRARLFLGQTDERFALCLVARLPHTCQMPFTRHMRFA